MNPPHPYIITAILFFGFSSGIFAQDTEELRLGKGVALKPSFVMILSDDQGYGDLSCFGGTHVKTPRIDQMAAEGARLTSFYVAAPLCTPSRPALMTGCYLIHHAKSPHEAFFYHSANELQAVRSGKWKLHLSSAKETQGSRGAVVARALFDLEEDISERTDILALHPEVSERLRSYAMTFQEELSRNKRPAGEVRNPKPLTK